MPKRILEALRPKLGSRVIIQNHSQSDSCRAAATAAVHTVKLNTGEVAGMNSFAGRASSIHVTEVFRIENNLIRRVEMIGTSVRYALIQSKSPWESGDVGPEVSSTSFVFSQLIGSTSFFNRLDLVIGFVRLLLLIVRFRPTGVRAVPFLSIHNGSASLFVNYCSAWSDFPSRRLTLARWATPHY